MLVVHIKISSCVGTKSISHSKLEVPEEEKVHHYYL